MKSSRDHIIVIIFILLISISLINCEKLHYEEKSAKEIINIIEERLRDSGHQIKESKESKQSTNQETNEWIESRNIANYLDMHTIKELIIDIQVNFIFIGFSGEGNHAYNLDSSTLAEWFEHIEHSLPHVIVPFGEDYTTNDKYETPKTHIKYRFNIQVSKVDTLVTTLIEDAIYWNMRAEDPEYYKVENDGIKSEHNRFYTHPNLVSSLLASLTNHLGYSDKSYTLYILNPNHPLDEGYTYGYRTGFSNDELQILRSHQDALKSDIFSEWKKFKGYEFATMATEQNEEPGEVVQATDNISYKDITKQSKDWAKQMSTKFRSFKNDSIENHVSFDWTCNEETQDCVKLAEKMQPVNRALNLFKQGNNEEKFYILSSFQHDIKENCLVDSWVSDQRFTFLDLTAGPFEWGPSIGGTGLKSNYTLPIVPIVNNHHNDDKGQEGFIRKPYKVSIEAMVGKIEDEILLIDSMLEIHCMDQPKEDGQQDKEMYTIEETIQLCSDLLKSKAELERTLNTRHDPLTLDHELSKLDLLLGNNDEYIEDDNNNQFKSHMSAVLSDSLRYLIAQPQPLFTTRYSNRVNFHLFIISDHNKYDSRSDFRFNFEFFRIQMDKLKTPAQEFSYTIKSISMSDEPALALAYQSSLKTTLRPSIKGDGTFETITHHYIDSKEIKYQLTRLNPDHHNDDDHTVTMESKHIPIFIFSLGSEHPVFIDKTLQSKTLNNMVIAVQTDIFDYESSTFSCNGQKVRLYLGNPMSAVLSATATALGGLVPQYISYSQAQQSVVQNWQWTVGNSPFSKTFTFPFPRFSIYQRDIIHRNYIISSLERSISITNLAIDKLLNHRTSLNGYSTFIQYPFLELKSKYYQIRSQWSEALLAIEEFNFAKGVAKAVDSETNALRFFEEVKSIDVTMKLAQCTSTPQSTTSSSLFGLGLGGSLQSSSRTPTIILICMAINLILILSFVLLHQKKSKLKIN